jgi:predicted  nucleic acid-binding Zn-ribbon protein
MESLSSGTIAGSGSFRCRRCGYVLTLTGTDRLSDCPGCGGRDFVRASLFDAAIGGAQASRANGARATLSGQPGRIVAGGGAGGAGGPDGGELAQQTMLGGSLAEPEPIDGEEWLEQARELAREPGEYLAYEQDGQIELVALTREWTRIGRSLAADVRFDDPTVSRRHALVVRQADGVRMLDDRSLNGVFVNGARIEWKVLGDGDEILVGRYRLRFLSVAGDRGGRPRAAERHGG